MQRSRKAKVLLQGTDEMMERAKNWRRKEGRRLGKTRKEEKEEESRKKRVEVVHPSLRMASRTVSQEDVFLRDREPLAHFNNRNRGILLESSFHLVPSALNKLPLRKRNKLQYNKPKGFDSSSNVNISRRVRPIPLRNRQLPINHNL